MTGKKEQREKNNNKNINCLYRLFKIYCASL